jgi:hypothetical protein
MEELLDLQSCEDLRSEYPNASVLDFKNTSLKTNSRIFIGSYSMDNGRSHPWLKRSEREADHSLPPSAEDKMRGAIPPVPHYSFTVFSLINQEIRLTPTTDHSIRS